MPAVADLPGVAVDKGLVGDYVALIFFLAILYVLVRPRSVAADAVREFSAAMVALVKTVTDM